MTTITDADKSIRRRRNRGIGAGHYIRSDLWTCTFDPDGDFTGRKISNLEVREMMKHHSFSPGTLLCNGDGEEIRI
jgi:hypothetical protein